MPKIAFKAVAKSSGLPVKVEVFLTDHQHGYTSAEEDEILEFEHKSDGPIAWYAMVKNIRVATGEHAGGTIVLEVDEKESEATIKEVTPN